MISTVQWSGCANDRRPAASARHAASDERPRVQPPREVTLTGKWDDGGPYKQVGDLLLCDDGRQVYVTNHHVRVIAGNRVTLRGVLNHQDFTDAYREAAARKDPPKTPTIQLPPPHLYTMDNPTEVKP